MKKNIRLFISSTFSDFTKEREVLQTKVFPRIKEYASSQGYVFQPIDLRWGVSNEAQLDQKTLELCLSEVRACKTHTHPNFLIMLGDRYGWIPLPYAIEVEEFETLLSLIDSSEDKTLLQEWYKKDLNQLRASYILKEREGKYVDYDAWLEVESSLRAILQNAVSNSELSDEKKRKYFTSATEAEVEEGIIPYIAPTLFHKDELLSKDSKLATIDPEHIFGFFRDVDKDSQKEDKFIQDDYEKAQEFKTDVKQYLPNNNTLNASTKQLDKENLDEAYLEEFEKRVTEFLKTIIDAQKQQQTNLKLTPLQLEQQAQNYYATQKRKNFIAQEDILNSIENYITSDSKQALVIYGPSGRGKSSIVAQAIKNAEESLNSKVVYRFIGATPVSSSSKEILTSIFEELGVDVRSEKEKASQNNKEDIKTPDANENQESFEEFSKRIYSELLSIKENVTIFIDALDQLQNEDEFLWLPQELPNNVKIIVSALNDENYKEDTKYFNTLKTKTDKLIEVEPFSQATQLLKILLAKESRTLDSNQEEYFLKQFASSPSPLSVCNYSSTRDKKLDIRRYYTRVSKDSTRDNKRVYI